MTKRLPASLKKKLQASLESLSAKEAGRLYAIYAHEADRKGVELSDYGPIKELWEAFNVRVARSRGKPDEAEAVNCFNGLVLLTNLFVGINFDFGAHILMALASEAMQVKLTLFLLLQQDFTTEAIRRIREAFIEQPKPLTREEYDWLIQWNQSDHLIDLSSAASFIDGEGEDSDADTYSAIYDALAEKLRAGELVGGESIFDPELDSSVLISDGTIPAWAALRMVWRQYVASQGLRVYDLADYADFAPEMVDRVGDMDGEPLNPDALRKLAADFYKACRRRPWGKKMVAKVDPDVLVQLLTQSSNPLLHRNAPDLGRVDWASFRRTERDRKGEPFEADLAATVTSLNALDPDFRKGYNFVSDYYREQFYPTEMPSFARAERARLFRMMAQLDTTRQPFTFDRKEEGMMTLSEFMGIKFATPFEQKVTELRKMNDQLASTQLALKILSDRYFGGLPVLLSDMETLLDSAEEAVRDANEVLNVWLDRLQTWPWEIDATELRPGEPEVDQVLVDELIEKAVMVARNRSRLTESEALLFGEK